MTTYQWTWVAGLVILGCNKSESDTATGNASTSAAAAQEAAPNKCEPLGCSGDGTLASPCRCKGQTATSPFQIKYTGTYSDVFHQPQFEVKNTTDKAIHWGSYVVYYYDKSGRQLEATIGKEVYKNSRGNGSLLMLKPNETRKLSLGFEKKSEPKGISGIEVVVDGWCFGTAMTKDELCVRTERAPEERARSGI